MGNLTIKDDLRRVQDKDYDDSLIDQYAAKLWTFEEQDSLRYHQLCTLTQGNGNASHGTGEAFFPTQCGIEAPDWENSEAQASPDAHNTEVTMTAGFTTGEKKIDVLGQEGKFLFHFFARHSKAG